MADSVNRALALLALQNGGSGGSGGSANLSGYVKKSELNSQLEDYATVEPDYTILIPIAVPDIFSEVDTIKTTPTLEEDTISDLIEIKNKMMNGEFPRILLSCVLQEEGEEGTVFFKDIIRPKELTFMGGGYTFTIETEFSMPMSLSEESTGLLGFKLVSSFANIESEEDRYVTVTLGTITNGYNKLNYMEDNSTSRNLNDLDYSCEIDVNCRYYNSPYDEEDSTEDYPLRVSVIAIGDFVKQKVCRLKAHDNITYQRFYDGENWSNWVDDKTYIVTKEEYEEMLHFGQLDDRIYYVLL